MHQTRSVRAPLVCHDGFDESVVVVDEATGRYPLQGDMNGKEPRSGFRGARINPHLLAFEGGGRAVPACGRRRCIRPDH